MEEKNKVNFDEDELELREHFKNLINKTETYKCLFRERYEILLDILEKTKLLKKEELKVVSFFEEKKKELDKEYLIMQVDFFKEIENKLKKIIQSTDNKKEIIDFSFEPIEYIILFNITINETLRTINFLKKNKLKKEDKNNLITIQWDTYIKYYEDYLKNLNIINKHIIYKLVSLNDNETNEYLVLQELIEKYKNF